MEELSTSGVLLASTPWSYKAPPPPPEPNALLLRLFGAFVWEAAGAKPWFLYRLRGSVQAKWDYEVRFQIEI